MARVISVAMQKGGTGKTTSALNLAAALVERKQRVLVIDFDPQANLTEAAGLNPDEQDGTIYTAITSVIRTEEMVFRDLIVPTDVGFDLFPASIELTLAEQDLNYAIRREYVLSTILDHIQSEYDFILIDCGPSLGLLTVNALTASNSVLIPVQVEYLAAKSVELMLGQIARVRKTRLNPDLEIEGMLLTMADERTRMSRQVIDATRTRYKHLTIFDMVVKRSIRFPESTAVGESILSFDPDGDGAQAYRQLADKVMNTHGTETRSS